MAVRLRIIGDHTRERKAIAWIAAGHHQQAQAVPGNVVDDATLVARARAGDSAAFEELVRRHYRAAWVVALAVTGSRVDAEDVCQDAWVRALEKLDSLRQPELFAHWLLQVVRNTAHNRRVYEKRRAAAPFDDSAVAAQADPRHDPEALVLGARLEDALAQLNETQREVVLLHDLEGWEHRAIAQALGLSETNSRQHLFQARKRLRARLDEEYPGEGRDG